MPYRHYEYIDTQNGFVNKQQNKSNHFYRVSICDILTDEILFVSSLDSEIFFSINSCILLTLQNN